MTIFYSYVQLPEGTTYNLWLCWEDGGWCLSATVPVVKPEGSPALWSATTRNFFHIRPGSDMDTGAYCIIGIYMDDMYICMSLGFYHMLFYHSEHDDSISHFLLVSAGLEHTL